MKKLIVLPILLTGCSMFTPETGTHYTVRYDKIEVEVDDYTDRNGIEFEYTNENGTSVTLKKNEVNTTNPAEVIMGKAAENQAAALELLNKVIN